MWFDYSGNLYHTSSIRVLSLNLQNAKTTRYFHSSNLSFTWSPWRVFSVMLYTRVDTRSHIAEQSRLCVFCSVSMDKKSVSWSRPEPSRVLQLLVI